MSVIGSLSNLEVFQLKSCDFEGTTWETNEGEFHQLKSLLLKDSNLVHWETEESHFPCLECLVLHNCKDIESIPSQIGEILTLQQIILTGCKPSVEYSANSIKEEQRDMGNEDFQLHIYPNYRNYKASGVTSFRRMYASRALRENIRVHLMAYQAALKFIDALAVT